MHWCDGSSWWGSIRLLTQRSLEHFESVQCTVIEVFTVHVFTNKFSVRATCERLLNPAYLAEVADMMHYVHTRSLGSKRNWTASPFPINDWQLFSRYTFTRWFNLYWLQNMSAASPANFWAAWYKGAAGDIRRGVGGESQLASIYSSSALRFAILSWGLGANKAPARDSWTSPISDAGWFLAVMVALSSLRESLLPWLVRTITVNIYANTTRTSKDIGCWVVGHTQIV